MGKTQEIMGKKRVYGKVDRKRGKIGEGQGIP